MARSETVSSVNPMAHLYIAEHLTTAQPGDEIVVTGDEARHATKVSRLRVGETIRVGNGKGLICSGEVGQTSPESFTVSVTQVEESPERAPRVWVVQALAKGDRSERAVELCTEFGAHGFIPWQASRSITQWNDTRASKGQAKWQRIAREASKQSLRAWVPIVQRVHSTEAIASLARNPQACVIILHPRDAAPLTELSLDTHVHDVYLCVGPEGGVSDAELDTLREAGAMTAVVGDEILRTSSAGAAGLSALNITLGRW